MSGVLLDPLTGRPEGQDDKLHVVRNLGVVEELASLEAQGWKPRLAKMLLENEPMAADGIYYHDSRGPWLDAAQTAIVLAATDKLLYPGFMTSLPGDYFKTKGKRLYLRVYGTITTAATPGNIGVELYFGTTDAGGTLLASSAAIALVAAQATIPFLIDAYVQCRLPGPAGVGSLFAWARAKFGTAVIASPNDDFFVPASAPAAVGVDTTAVGNGFNVQIKRSGSTAESVTVQDLLLVSLN